MEMALEISANTPVGSKRAIPATEAKEGVALSYLWTRVGVCIPSATSASTVPKQRLVLHVPKQHQRQINTSQQFAPSMEINQGIRTKRRKTKIPHKGFS
jgi:hypothetical protein